MTARLVVNNTLCLQIQITAALHLLQDHISRSARADHHDIHAPVLLANLRPLTVNQA